MAQRAREKPNGAVYGVLPWAIVAATLYVLLTVVSRTPRLFRIGMGLGRGLVIGYVVPNSPADIAGLEVRDRVVELDGHPIYTRNRFRFLSAAHQAGDTISIDIERPGGERLAVPVKLEPAVDAPQGALVVFTVGLAFLITGTTVYILRPEEQVSRVFFWACVAMSLSYGTPYANHPWLGLLETVAFFAPSLIVHLFLVFPLRRLWFSTAWGKALVYAPAVILFSLSSLASLGVARVDMVHVVTWAPSYIVVGAAVGLGIVLYTMATAEKPVIRQQLKWIAWGIGTAAGLNALHLITSLSSLWPELIDLDLVNWSVLVVPLAFAFSILRYRLFDIDTVINKSIVYVVLVLGIIASYFVVGWLLIELRVGFYLTSPAAVAILVVLLSVLFSPLYRAVQRAVDRVM